MVMVGVKEKEKKDKLQERQKSQDNNRNVFCSNRVKLPTTSKTQRRLQQQYIFFPDLPQYISHDKKSSPRNTSSNPVLYVFMRSSSKMCMQIGLLDAVHSSKRVVQPIR